MKDTARPLGKYVWHITGTLKCLVPFGDLLFTDENLTSRQAIRQYRSLSKDRIKTIKAKFVDETRNH